MSEIDYAALLTDKQRLTFARRAYKEALREHYLSDPARYLAQACEQVALPDA